MSLTARQRYLFALLGVLLTAVLFRLPFLVNAGDVNSDAAVVGLQARHILHGEWSAFLWGAPYQSSFDSFIAAGFFAVLGPTPLALMLSALLGCLVMIALGFDAVARHVGVAVAAVSSLLWAFVPHVLEVPSVCPPRQWCFTAVMLAVWALARAGTSVRSERWIALGLAAGGLAVYFDLFATQMVPPMGVLALWVAWGAREGRGRRLGAVVVGTLLAAVIFFAAHPHYFTEEKPVVLLWSVVGKNWKLFHTLALPEVLGYGVPTQLREGASWTTWQPGVLFQLVQWLGAALFVGVVLAGVVLACTRRASWTVRGFAVMALVATAVSVAGFQLSGMVSDLWSARYLSPLLLFAPFAVAPVAQVFGVKRLSVLLGAYLLSALVGGWVGHGAYVSGMRPVVTHSATMQDELELGRVLREKKVEAALAQYWLAYRDAFVLEEKPVFVPLFGTRWNNRYLPYWDTVKSAPVIAYVFHPSQPGVPASTVERALQTEHADYERLQTAGGFTVLIMRRGPQKESH